MYDSVFYWLGIEQAGTKNLLAHAENHLTNLTEHYRPDGQVYLSGYLHNYKANISMAGISLKGSLAKYYLGDNLHTLTRADSQRAVEKLSDEVRLQLLDAKVTRFDLAQNFLMRHDPKAYYHLLGDCQHYKRIEQPESLYYNNGMRTKLFYNKIAEAKAKGVNLPEVLTGQNCLRYEMRFTKRLPNQFNRHEVTASTLYDEQFYLMAVKKWQQEYNSIQKLKEINLNYEIMKTPKDYFKQLQLFAVQVIGQDNVMKSIDQMRLQGIFDKPEYYSRLKKEVKQLCNTPELTTSSELIKELDNKVDQVCKHYR